MELYASLRPGVTPEAGGAGFQVLEIARRLRELGYPVSLIAGDFGQPFREKIEGFSVYRANRVAHDRSIRRGLRNVWRLFRAMQATGANVFVLRSTRFLAGMCWLFARLLRADFVFMIASMNNCDPHDHEGVPPLLSRLYAHSLRRANLVTVQTRQQMDLLRERFGADAVIVPNGITVPPFAPPGEPPATDVLWVGSLKPIKRPEWLLEFCRLCPDLEFTVIGGPGADTAYTDRIVAQLQTLRNVRYLGFVPPDRVAEHYGRARVLLSTSQQEGFPNTYLHAWSRGVPTCSPSIDPDGVIARNGLGIIDPDPHALAHSLRSLLRDPLAYAATSRRCHDFVSSHHSSERTAAAFLEALPRTGR
jgi:glycosyltransferase involved in cell wall biosynthesis